MAGASPTGPLRVHVDVTDTVATHWRAGIQRVVAQLLAQLSLDDRLEVVPVVWLEAVHGFRTLTPDEQARLAPRVAAGAEPSPAPRGASSGVGSGAASAGHRVLAAVRPVLGRVRRAVVALLVAVRVEPQLRRARRWWHRRGRDRALVPLALELRPGSVLFEMDTVWNNTWVDRAELYRRLQAHGVHVAALVYDLLPQQHPEWFEASLVAVSDRTVAAQAAHAEVLFAISAHTATSLVDWARTQGLSPVEPTVVALGADAARPAATDSTRVALPAELDGVRYALSVGTVEPRKNHATLLDAFEQIWAEDDGAHLVVVGRPGWHNDAVLERLARHPEAGRRLRWYRGAGDELLATLYAHARVVAVTSLTEGYGLPVIEALAQGVPVVSSDGGALVEAGGDLVRHLAPTDVAAWAEALGELLVHDDAVEAQRARLAGYRTPTWAACGARVADVLVERFTVPGR